MHKVRTLILLTTLVSAAVFADTAVTIDVHGVTNTDGQLLLTVFDSKKTWLKKPMLSKWTDIADNVTDGVLSIDVMLPAGDYAFQVFQDVDSNKKMKTNFIGIPKEPVGVSRDAKGRFGPPKFKNAVITIGDEAVTLPINLAEI